MTSYRPENATDDLLEAVHASQQTVLDLVRVWADAVSPVLRSVPSIPVPFADRLPKPEDVVAGSYQFAEKFLASQRQFSEELLKAAAPLVPGTTQPETAAE